MATSIDPTIRELRQTINRLEAMISAKGAFTLREGATSTQVFHIQAGINSAITVQPTSKLAAQELASGNMWIENDTRGFTVHHSSAATTRTFNYTVSV